MNEFGQLLCNSRAAGGCFLKASTPARKPFDILLLELVFTPAELPVQQLGQLTVEELHAIHSDVAILDVRDQNEWDEGHIKGALHIPYYFIEQRLKDGHNELNSYRDRQLAVTCASGQRSAIACSLLKRHGFKKLFNVVGGMDAWKKANLAL